MHKSSLIEILKTFSQKELTKFEEFVNSPYFNKNKNVTALFAEIEKYAPEYENGNLQKEKIWESLFAGRKYNYGIMKNIIFDLNKLCETFVLLEKYLKNSYQREYDLIETLGSRNIRKLTLSKIDQFEKKVKSELEQNKYSAIDDYLLTTSHFNYTKEGFINIYNLKLDKSEPIRLASEYLLYYFLIQSFKLINNTLSHELQGNPSMEKTLLEKFFMKLEEHSILEDLLSEKDINPDKLSRIVNCFYYMYKAISSGGNTESYNRFKTAFKDNIDIFSGFELQNLNNCRTVCLTNLKIPYAGAAKEGLEWFKFLMEKGALRERNGLVTHSTMSNLVSYAVSLKETEFAEKFVEKYYHMLPEDSRENTYNYCRSILNFGKGEFGKSLEHLSRIRNEKLMLKYNVKKIYMKIYYELNDYESFVYAFDSFAHFKKRNKLASESKALKFNKFGVCVKALFKLRNAFSQFESDELRRDILNNIVTEKTWLLEKLDELEMTRVK